MSQRAHFWVRLVALAVIVAAAYAPRADVLRVQKSARTVAAATR